jgi:hypothetical protein
MDKSVMDVPTRSRSRRRSAVLDTAIPAHSRLLVAGKCMESLCRLWISTKLYEKISGIQVLWEKFCAHAREIFFRMTIKRLGLAHLVFPAVRPLFSFFPSLYLEVPGDNPAHFGILSHPFTPFHSRRCTIDRARQG